MNRCVFKILVMMLFVGSIAKAANLSSNNERINVDASRNQHFVAIHIITFDPKQQLSFLMQGLSVELVSDTDTIFINFPNAMMVRDKVKRHPNEVKPTFKDDSIGEEVRPDLQPLIAALNDTTIFVKSGEKMITSKDFTITLDRDTKSVEYSVELPVEYCNADSVGVVITSSPYNAPQSAEFQGKRRSREIRMNPNGLGQAPSQHNSKDRVVNYYTTIAIKEE